MAVCTPETELPADWAPTVEVALCALAAERLQFMLSSSLGGVWGTPVAKRPIS